jgi:hypothetical protein
MSYPHPSGSRWECRRDDRASGRDDAIRLFAGSPAMGSGETTDPHGAPSTAASTLHDRLQYFGVAALWPLAARQGDARVNVKDQPWVSLLCHYLVDSVRRLFVRIDLYPGWRGDFGIGEIDDLRYSTAPDSVREDLDARLGGRDLPAADRDML